MLKAIAHLSSAILFTFIAFYLGSLDAIVLAAKTGVPSLNLPGYIGLIPGFILVIQALKQIILAGHAWDIEKARLEKQGMYATTKSGTRLIGPHPHTEPRRNRRTT